MATGAPQPDVKKVSDIKKSLMQPALTSHFECHFHIPDSFKTTGRQTAKNFINQSVPITSEVQRLLTLSCSEASLPGSSLSTHELNNDYTGVTQRHAYRRLYDDKADFTFYVNQDYTQIRLFEAWTRFIIGEQISDASKLNKSYRVEYPKTYKTNIYITKFERNIGSPTKSESVKKNSSARKIVYSFFNAFPTSVYSMPVSYDSSQLLKVTVSFSYDRYVVGNDSSVGSYSGPAPTTPSGVPKDPFAITPETQAQLNSAFSQNLDFGKFSAGSFTNPSAVSFDSTGAFGQTGFNLTQNPF